MDIQIIPDQTVFSYSFSPSSGTAGMYARILQIVKPERKIIDLANKRTWQAMLQRGVRSAAILNNTEKTIRIPAFNK